MTACVARAARRLLRRAGPRGLGFLIALAALVLGGMPSRAQDLRAVPVLTARVIDQTGTLTPTQTSGLEAKLAAFEREAGSQLVILIVPFTAPEDIASFAQRVGESWKIGRRDVGDGLLIVVAKDERKLRIEVAKTLEGAVPDLAARQIIDRQLTPAFRSGDYAGGLNAAVDALTQRIRGEALPAPAPRGDGPAAEGTQWQDMALFFLLAVPVMGAVLTGLFGRKLGSLVTGAGAGGLAWAATASVLVGGAAALVALVLVGVLGFGATRRGRGLGGAVPPIIWGGGGGGWGGGGGGGGGFSSGGGGDFGGGGASGDW